MYKNLILRIPDSVKEPIDAIIDSDDVCSSDIICGIMKIIPIFNIIYNFWSENNVQFDTVFESLKNCDALLKKIQDLENQDKKYIIASLVNHNEELGVIPLAPFKEMLLLYKKYRAASGYAVTDADLSRMKEYLCEFVRRNHFENKNGRFNSVFFYENLEVAVMASKNAGYRKTDKFCKVEIVETRSMDRYDGRWLSDIKPTCIFKEFMEAITNYWSGSMTPNPKVEYLFSGKYILKEL